MDAASPVRDSCKKRYGLRPRQNSGHQKDEIKPEGTESVLADTRLGGPANVDCENLTMLAEQDKHISPPKPVKVDKKPDAAKNSSKSANKRKKVASKQRAQRYPLRSSFCGGRVLRSMSKEKSKTSPESVNTPLNPVTGKRKRRRKVKRALNDEFSKTRKRVRYLLTRMNYEQNLIDAYSGEGWKGQSAEKIRPEKELERAKSEILRCKLRIRDLFQNLESLSSEGRFQESLFDSEGEICSEDIFCAKCGSKDLTDDNDIILCDGICDRGFHQKCLNPPLLSEDIPVGEEGWLCPACDCKVDCIDLLNEFQGNDLTIDDSWEEVFPEAASIANGEKLHDEFPSDDSEDDDYDPDVSEVDVEDEKEGSISEESDFTSTSEDSRSSNPDKQIENLGFSSDDSEDDDYEPNGPDRYKSNQEDGSSSDESDYTSDSDDFCAQLCKTSGANEDAASSLPNLRPLPQSNGEGCSSERNKFSINSDLLSISKPDLNQKNVFLASGKRLRERLNYKKLYDEAYRKTSSDSSDDEEWSDMTTPKKGRKADTGNESDVLLKANAHDIENHRTSRSTMRKLPDVETARKSDLDLPQFSQVVNEHTPKRTCPKLDSDTMCHTEAEQHSASQDPYSNGNTSSTSVSRKLGKIASQKLYESFQMNQYPTREEKESLAEELGITLQQVSKWFGNTCHSFRVANKGSSQAVAPTPAKESNLTASGINHIKSDEGMGQSSTGNEGKQRESVQPRISDVGARHGNSNEDLVVAKDSPQVSQVVSESTPEGTHPKLDSSTINHAAEQHNDSQDPDSNGNRSSTSVSRKLGKVASQKLYESFQKNQYPSREKKESLAEELGITFQQVNKWFDNTRHSFRVSAQESSQSAIPAPEKDGHQIATSTTDEGVGQVSRSKHGKVKKSVQIIGTKAGAKSGKRDGDKNSEAVDKERQQAIARELRKMKSGR